jgi:hypothetical protein
MRTKMRVGLVWADEVRILCGLAPFCFCLPFGLLNDPQVNGLDGMFGG